MHKILSFDSSNNTCSVSVSCGQAILSYNEDNRPSMQAENLVPLIELSLKEAECDYNDIDYLAVTTGPGSFTGIRIGLAVANAILHSTNIKPIGITNFEFCYYRLKQQIKNFDKAFILLEAYRGQQYIQEFNVAGPVSDPILVNNHEVANILYHPGALVACAGNGIATLYQVISNMNLIILPRFTKIKAYHIARFAHDIISTGSDRSKIEPLYIRAPDAIKQN
ncbi:MAG: tRNA (adenosine(37)-N6)-threonylcarbamoyltransferase complex dimerization subunit type 1 TsaB [Rickettsiaceae bacterium]|nr:tRNA (adenosine(37)-N6)-threonylcarbamoyltransferase complex dimerization subunit type 1 TsaB [Rickettsiaceae bacterium]